MYIEVKCENECMYMYADIKMTLTQGVLKIFCGGEFFTFMTPLPLCSVIWWRCALWGGVEETQLPYRYHRGGNVINYDLLQKLSSVFDYSLNPHTVHMVPYTHMHAYTLSFKTVCAVSCRSPSIVYLSQLVPHTLAWGDGTGKSLTSILRLFFPPIQQQDLRSKDWFSGT